jgi:hypothetical protein
VASPRAWRDVTTWTALLEQYEATIVALERAAASGDEPPAGEWTPPAVVPAEDATPEQRQRFVTLQARAAACAAQVRTALAAASDDLHTLRRTSAAARSYGRIEHLAGPRRR